MRLTAKTSYGVRALICLALAYGENKPVSVGYVSKREKISSVYLDQIFNTLKKLGIVKSLRGPKGGYILAEDPSGITVYDVVTALEEKVFPGRCATARGTKGMCSRAGSCASKEVWDEVGEKIKDTLSAVSLADLAERTLELQKDKAGSYEKSIS